MQENVAATIQSSGALSADDRLEIHQLIAGEYFLHEDVGNFEAWGDLFTTDGSFFPNGKEPVFGRKNLVEFARRRWESRPELKNWIHFVSNVMIWPTPEGAKAYCYQMTVEKRGSEFRIVLVSAKSDELRREDGKWRFHVRRAMPLGSG